MAAAPQADLVISGGVFVLYHEASDGPVVRVQQDTGHGAGLRRPVPAI